MKDTHNAESDRPCWALVERFPKFCASLANGHGRCRKGTCFVLEARQGRLQIDGEVGG